MELKVIIVVMLIVSILCTIHESQYRSNVFEKQIGGNHPTPRFMLFLLLSMILFIVGLYLNENPIYI